MGSVALSNPNATSAYCESCGAEFGSDSRFCAKCGFPLGIPERTSAAYPVRKRRELHIAREAMFFMMLVVMGFSALTPYISYATVNALLGFDVSWNPFLWTPLRAILAQYLYLLKFNLVVPLATIVIWAFMLAFGCVLTSLKINKFRTTSSGLGSDAILERGQSVETPPIVNIPLGRSQDEEMGPRESRPTRAKMGLCRNCGSRIAADGNFCEECGAPVRTATAPES